MIVKFVNLTNYYMSNMVLYLRRFIGVSLLEINSHSVNKTRLFSTRKTWSSSKTAFLGILGLITGGTGVIIYSLDQSVQAGELELHPAKFKWAHNGLFDALDHASVRRGYEVFKQVCASCHSLKFVAYRNLVGVTHSEAAAKAEAEEQMIDDGPDEEGNMFKRPGKLSDYIPAPYPNEEAARAANSGAFPPDLSYIVLGREGGEDYIFSLLTGYCDPPAGVTIREGQNYNPYFIGGAIAMAQPIFEDSAVYSDGTHAHASQLAKDVVVFLKWAAEPEFDDRKLMMLRMFGFFGFSIALAYYAVRTKGISIKTRKFALKSHVTGKPPVTRSKKCD